MNTREKIVPVPDILAHAKNARSSGRKIIVVSSRFNLISLKMTEKIDVARGTGAVVIAVVAPDSPKPTLLPTDARAQLAAALGSVDFVVISDAKEIVDALKPDVVLEVSSDLAPRLIERFRLEHRE